MIKRICVYIDGANFYGGLTSINKRFSDTKFDFENYINYLVGSDKLIKIYYYNALVKKKINEKIWKKQKDFFDRLRKISKCKVSLCTRKSRLNILGEEYHTIKGDDIFLALDMIENCYDNQFDKVILISGDGDFTELLKRINYERTGVPLIFDEKIYHQRSKVETVFSVIKRKYGSFILSRNYESQKKEILFRMIAYNLDRKIILSLVIIGIHQSLISKPLKTCFSI